MRAPRSGLLSIGTRTEHVELSDQCRGGGLGQYSKWLNESMGALTDRLQMLYLKAGGIGPTEEQGGTGNWASHRLRCKGLTPWSRAGFANPHNGQCAGHHSPHSSPSLLTTTLPPPCQRDEVSRPRFPPPVGSSVSEKLRWTRVLGLRVLGEPGQGVVSAVLPGLPSSTRPASCRYLLH